jgi:hypothetical protein
MNNELPAKSRAEACNYFEYYPVSDSDLSLRRIAEALEALVELTRNKGNEKVCGCSPEGCACSESEGTQGDRGESAHPREEDGQDPLFHRAQRRS